MVAGETIRRRVDVADDALDFPILHDLKAEGATLGTNYMVTYVTDRVDGFTEKEISDPAFDDLGPERHECATVRRHRVVVEVATYDMPQPLPLNGDRLMHTPLHLLFDHPQLRLHAVAPGLPFDLEFASAGFAADEGEA